MATAATNRATSGQHAMQPPPVPSGRTIGPFASEDLINGEGSAIHRRLFVDPDLYRLEQQRIFGSCWLYVGHESQLLNNGDFLTTTMGEDPVFVTRDRTGRLRAFLNSCSHRGAMVCRTDGGNSKLFKCPYHGWTFNNEGQLAAVPRQGPAYGDGFDRSRHGLREVGQLDTYQGLIIATWNAQAPSLPDYLGEMKYY